MKCQTLFPNALDPVTYLNLTPSTAMPRRYVQSAHCTVKESQTLRDRTAMHTRGTQALEFKQYNPKSDFFLTCSYALSTKLDEGHSNIRTVHPFLSQAFSALLVLFPLPMSVLCVLIYLNRHGPQIGTQEQEPHELIGFYGNQVVDLSQGHLTHGQVGSGEPEDFIVYHSLQGEGKDECQASNLNPTLISYFHWKHNYFKVLKIYKSLHLLKLIMFLNRNLCFLGL